MNRPKDITQKSCHCNTEPLPRKLQAPPIPKAPRGRKSQHFPITTAIKKTVVRNTENPIPETRIIKDDLKEYKDKGIQTNTKRKLACTLNTGPSYFEAPKPYTLIDLSKKIASLEVEDQKKKDIAADDKVLRNLNFPYDKPVYKDLIPLVCKTTQSPPLTVRSPLPQRDREPILSDFIERKNIPNYYILPSVEIEDKMSVSRNNNLRLYNILEFNS